MTTRRWTNAEVNRVAAETASWLDIYPFPTFRGWTKSRGWATRSSGTFSLPEWIHSEPDEYVIAYIVHEVAHYARDSHGFYVYGHGPAYREVEDRGLAYWQLQAYLRSPRGNRYILSLAYYGTEQQVRPSGLPGSPYRLVKPPAPRAKCACGCGETPKGKRSRFLPGHDARMH